WHMRVGAMLVVGCVLACTTLAAACGSGDTSGGTTAGSGGGTASSSTGMSGPTYGGSACAACVGQACAGAKSACEGNHKCKVFLDCLEACPLSMDGSADPACVAKCPHTSDDLAAQEAEDAFETCRGYGAGAYCDACGNVPQSCPASSETQS